MDIVKDYTSQTLQLAPDYEGGTVATLVALKHNAGNRKSVLYLHGYIDYFFQAHLGEQFNKHQYDFYALDLRKYGRSLLAHQSPNFCRNINEYFEEITAAILEIKKAGNHELLLLGHSTGGLIASNYMNSGQEKESIKALVLNSPFLDFNQSALEKKLVYFASKPMAKLFPYSKVNGALSPAFAQSLHKDYYGEWDFNLKWKPIKGFPTYFAWVLAIRQGHKNLEQSNIAVPVLVMHSSGSSKQNKFSEKAMKQDIVLDVEDIKRVGANLGRQVTLLEVADAQHDIFLSPKNVREKAFKQMFAWLSSLDQ